MNNQRFADLAAYMFLLGVLFAIVGEWFPYARLGCLPAFLLMWYGIHRSFDLKSL